MNKTTQHATARRLYKNLETNSQQIRAIVGSDLYSQNLYTTEEFKELDRLQLESDLLNIEAETFLADVKAQRHPLKFLKRYIFNNH